MQVSDINLALERKYGKFDTTDKPLYRVVWSEDQIEKRLVSHNDNGFELLIPEVREVPKYRQWIKEKWLLEALTEVPVVNQNELPASALSYECVWVFEDKKGNYLPAHLEVCHIVIGQIRKNVAGMFGVKYQDPELTPEGSIEEKQKRVAKLEEMLFGNETDVTDALRYKDGVVVPSNYEGNKNGS